MLLLVNLQRMRISTNVDGDCSLAAMALIRQHAEQEALEMDDRKIQDWILKDHLAEAMALLCTAM